MIDRSRTLPGIATAFVLAGAAAGAAADDGAAAMPMMMLDRIVVTATRVQARQVAGSVHVIEADALDQHSYSDTNRILRQVPGLNIVEEEGFGLRPSIGIRGSGTDRNAKIAVLEDGVPIAPAPYSAPSAYYFPRTPRMHAVEVTKGPAAIKYGPQTVAGAVSMLSTPIPGTPGSGVAGKADLFGGEFGTLRGHGLVGGVIDTGRAFDVGLGLETLQERSDGFKRLDSGGGTGFEIQDYVAKLALHSGEDAALAQSLEFKWQYSDEHSDETYLGLALDDFRADPYRRYRASQLDSLDVRHRTWQATHRIDFRQGLDLTTNAYYTRTERAWYKLNDVRNAADTGFTGLSSVLGNPAAYPVEYATLTGTASAPGALRMRNNAREYYAAGIQSVLGAGFDVGAARHEVELSLRYHRDQEDRFQQDDRYQMVNGLMALTAGGAPGSQDNRVGEAEAWALFVRDTIEWDRLTLAPGLRYESVSLRQARYGSTDPDRSATPTTVHNSVDVLLPGFGATYRLTGDWKLIAGLHRGFVNPSPGSSADAEESWNVEAGLRFNRGAASLETIAFLVDYDNLVGTCTASTGGGCTIGDQFNGGTARVHGLELVAAYDAAALFGTRWSIPLSAVYTWTAGEFTSSFNSSFSEWGNVTAGDELPLVPEHQLTLNAGVEAGRWRLFMSMNHVAATRSRAGSGTIPVTGRVDERTLFDLSGEFTMSPGLRLFTSVQNLTDEVYNVAFRPAGARPGAPRTFLAGIKLQF